MNGNGYIQTKSGILVPSQYMQSSSVPFEGASTTYRMRTWGLSSAGPVSALSVSLDNLKFRSRDLTRNDPTADGGIESLVTNLIGDSISPRWQTGDKVLNKEIQDLWKESIEEMDYDGLLDFYGIEALVARSLLESGEVLAHFTYPKNRNFLVPFQIQLLETDHLSKDMDQVLPNGNKLRQGIIFDKDNRRIGYQLYRTHPGESFFLTEASGLDQITIKSDDLKHIFKPLRPGQLRGRPWLATIIARMYLFSMYEDAELDRKKTAAMFAGFVESPVGDMVVPGLPGNPSQNYQGTDYVSLEPAIIQYLKPGQKMTFSNPADVGENYEVFIKQQLRRAARGLGITYEQLTGDLEKVNYSSIRAGLIEARRLFKMIQHHIIIHQVCKPVAARWMDMVVLSGLINIRDYATERRRYIKTEWTGKDWEWVDPIKDITAKILKVRAGFSSRTREIAEMGGHVEEVDEEIQNENKTADQNGFMFDTDPRKTTKSGVLQQSEEEGLKPNE